MIINEINLTWVTLAQRIVFSIIKIFEIWVMIITFSKINFYVSEMWHIGHILDILEKKNPETVSNPLNDSLFDLLYDSIH